MRTSNRNSTPNNATGVAWQLNNTVPKNNKKRSNKKFKLTSSTVRGSVTRLKQRKNYLTQKVNRTAYTNKTFIKYKAEMSN